jgi:hypothetical protein
MSPRRARHFSLPRQRKVPQRKAPPRLRPLRAAKGHTCAGSVAGCAAELAARWRAPLDQPRRVRARSTRAATRVPPRNHPDAGAARRGWGAQQPRGSSLRSTSPVRAELVEAGARPLQKTVQAEPVEASALPQTVRDEPVEAWLGRGDCVPWLSAGAGMSPRRARYFSLPRQRKVPQRKATPSLRPLRDAKGHTCAGSVAGCTAELAARWRAPLTSRGQAEHEARALRRACHPDAGAATRGAAPPPNPFGLSLSKPRRYPLQKTVRAEPVEAWLHSGNPFPC